MIHKQMVKLAGSQSVPGKPLAFGYQHGVFVVWYDTNWLEGIQDNETGLHVVVTGSAPKRAWTYVGTAMIPNEAFVGHLYASWPKDESE